MGAFGKDSLGKKDFDVKTLDKNGNEIPRVEHSVTAVISVDGNIKTFTRTLREKWSKKEGVQKKHLLVMKLFTK